MKALLAAAAVLLTSCASYQPGADYESLLTPFDGAPASLALTPGDFAVPEPLVPEGRPPVPAGSVREQTEFLLTWMGSHVTFDGSSPPPAPLTAANLWNASQARRPLNCLAASTLFASLAEGAGLSARVLWLYPRDLSDENHVIVLIWEAESSRWLAADPSYQTLFFDGTRALGPEELRSSVASGRPVSLSQSASWNGLPVEADYLHYLSKNLYRWVAAGSRGDKIQLTPPRYFGFGLPWGGTVVHHSQVFLQPPVAVQPSESARP